MSNPNSQGNTDPPKFSQDFEKGIKLQLKYLPIQLQNELMYRMQYDPAFIEQQLGLQHKYDPALAQEQRDALQRRDPQWLALHEGLGAKIQEALDRGYVDPAQKAAWDKWGASAGQTSPTRGRTYQALGNQVTGDVLRGGTADPVALKQMTQAILARQPALSYGEAQDMAAAVYTGQRGQALLQQRQQAAGQFLQAVTPEQQKEASLAAFESAMSPQMQTYGLAGTYIQPSNSIVGAENMVGQVQAPRSFGYVNPNAGYQGAQYGLQNFQNQMASQQGGGGGNPWTNALAGAGQGASIGSNFSGYGAAGGAVTGAALGAFGYPQYSSITLKKNLSRTGLKTKDGIELVDYDMDGRRWRGVIAEEVAEVRPDALFRFPGGRLGVFYDRLGIRVAEINQDAQEGVLNGN